MLKKVQIYKALDIEIKKQKGPIPVKEAYKGHHSLKEELSQPGMTLVGEVAGGNPLRGQVRDSYRASTHAKSLVENGARAISVATDRFLYFGDDKHLSEVRNTVKVPVIRRDFIFEEYQIEESKILGADAVFLLAALLEPERLVTLLKLARSKGLDVVVEVASEADLDRAVKAGADIVCVVGRNLDTWEPSWSLALDLLAKIPSKQCLRMIEAGIDSLEQLTQLEEMGIHGVVIGDALLDEFYPGKRLQQIRAGLESAKKPVRPKGKVAKVEELNEVEEAPFEAQTPKPASKKGKTAKASAPEAEPVEAAKPAKKASKKAVEPAPEPAPKPAKKAKAEPDAAPAKPAPKKAKAEPKAAKKVEEVVETPAKPAKKAAAPKAKAEPAPAEPKPAKKAPAKKAAEPASKSDAKKAEPKKPAPKKQAEEAAPAPKAAAKKSSKK